MALFIDNRHIPPAINLLDSLPLSGAASRARTRFMNALAPHVSALQDAEYALLTEHAALNPDGTPQVGEDGHITFTSPEAAEAFGREHHLLLAEQAKIEESYAGHFTTLQNALTQCSKEFTGSEAVVYDALLTALENSTQHGESCDLVGGEGCGQVDQTR